MCDQGSTVEFDEAGQTALTSDSGPIDPGYQWTETVDVSGDDEQTEGEDK